MSDKRAAKLKKQRKIEKQKALEEHKREIFEGVCEHEKAQGKGVAKAAGVELVWKAHKDVDRILFRISYMTALVSAIYVLAFNMGYGRKKRLPEVINMCRWGLVTVSNGERSNKQFADEMKGEFGVDIIRELMDRFLPFTNDEMLLKTGRSLDRAAEVSAVARRMPDMMSLIAYPLYFQFGFKRDKLNNVVNKVADTAIDILKNNSYEDYRLKILRKTDINICIEGSVVFNYSKPKEEQ